MGAYIWYIGKVQKLFDFASQPHWREVSKDSGKGEILMGRDLGGGHAHLISIDKTVLSNKNIMWATNASHNCSFQFSSTHIKKLFL